ncbi:MAG: tRNA-(ms[2]io[6]A)-hydroxylase [SAR86 cluster bacterium]|uniref:tRNA-(Ms[2]io[6]A)-hydroxylase n=1 Tax=SAR86 cluster bacterium TaxID=2030880 RepID=A0A2A4WV39_9GAMM|nr:MAG: tRNA-(ms[2]io[6]A)-hydroxylase [SAR86 cluster bacterium]
MLTEITDFLTRPTPDAWLQEALVHQDLLLIDHANCEKKAAATAMNLMYRHTNKPDLLKKMSQLAREELLHFQQVVEIMQVRGVEYVRLSPSRYAAGLRELIAKEERQQLIDTLIVGAFIEARSCERFAKLAPLLDSELQKFYRSLLKSEARHFEDYLALAREYSDKDIGPKLEQIAAEESRLISEPDAQFRFHSGPPLGESSFDSSPVG